MHIYKELSFIGDKLALDSFKKNAPALANSYWKCTSAGDYISFEYCGNKVEAAEVSIYYGQETWREGYIKICNIVPINKFQLSIEEYNAVLDLFYEEIIVPNKDKLTGLKVVGPESDVFDPLKYISPEALDKLKHFCNCANKSTGSAHPSDEQRWFDFICQTVDDGMTLDYDTIYRFLMDEEYWGKRNMNSHMVMGKFAWDEKHAAELASEYDNYVRILNYYIDRRQRIEAKEG